MNSSRSSLTRNAETVQFWSSKIETKNWIKYILPLWFSCLLSVLVLAVHGTESRRSIKSENMIIFMILEGIWKKIKSARGQVYIIKRKKQISCGFPGRSRLRHNVTAFWGTKGQIRLKLIQSTNQLNSDNGIRKFGKERHSNQHYAPTPGVRKPDYKEQEG